MNKNTGVAFFTLVLIASTWYHIRKVKQQTNDTNNLKGKEENKSPQTCH